MTSPHPTPGDPVEISALREQVRRLESIQQVGRQVTASLDLDSVLAAVVDAAVNLTGAEKGSLLLLDETTGELYMRAGRNFQEDFVSTFRLPVQDSLAGEVLRTGEPALFQSETPRKIKTAYLVNTLMMVPLRVKDQAIGVLQVDNRQSGLPFSPEQVELVASLAGYAAIAIENARLFSASEVERSKLETILAQIDEGAIVVDPDGRVILANRMARLAFRLDGRPLAGLPVEQALPHAELADLLGRAGQDRPGRAEITLDDGRTLNTLITPIPGVGLAATMQDITHLKELDRIKSEFVATVSHDLRSPLTAILGYVELIERVGPVNAQQKEFIRRVQFSVQSITALINDLLDLGRIEAGFEARKERVPIQAFLLYTLEGLQSRIEEKGLELRAQIPPDLPDVHGSPVRLRQLVANLVGNAIKYTPRSGRIEVRARAEGGQLILQVADNGLGIPPADQPYIFDKFYRSGNVPADIPGVGLGLAIVKLIVENHHGRIWVDSAPGQGTTFTIVLPALDPAS